MKQFEEIMKQLENATEDQFIEILDSNKEFEKWFFVEVLPSIMEHGYYISNDATTEQLMEITKEQKLQIIANDLIDPNKTTANTVNEFINVLKTIKPVKKRRELGNKIRKKIENNRRLSDNQAHVFLMMDAENKIALHISESNARSAGAYKGQITKSKNTEEL
jgi:hypothetical protein